MSAWFYDYKGNEEFWFMTMMLVAEAVCKEPHLSGHEAKNKPNEMSEYNFFELYDEGIKRFNKRRGRIIGF